MQKHRFVVPYNVSTHTYKITHESGFLIIRGDRQIKFFLGSFCGNKTGLASKVHLVLIYFANNGSGSGLL
jgi:hypothetical protein